MNNIRQVTEGRLNVIDLDLSHEGSKQVQGEAHFLMVDSMVMIRQPVLTPLSAINLKSSERITQHE